MNREVAGIDARRRKSGPIPLTVGGHNLHSHFCKPGLQFNRGAGLIFPGRLRDLRFD